MRQREPRRHERPYMGWIKGLPCIGCAVAGRVEVRSEAAHCGLAIAAHGWREAGVQEKADDRRCLPLCANCHREGPRAEHKVGQRQFWDRLGICPACLAEALGSAYDAQASGSAVIWQAVRGRRRDGLPTC
jgi:hypothetical protein